MTRTTKAGSPSVTIHMETIAPNVAVDAKPANRTRSRQIRSDIDSHFDHLFKSENDLDLMGAAIRQKLTDGQAQTTTEQIKTINAMRRALIALKEDGETPEGTEEILQLLNETLALIGKYKFNITSTYVG